MNASSEPIAAASFQSPNPDFSDLFQLHYRRVAQVIARVVQDSGRAEDLAVEAFWKLWRNPNAQLGNPGAWLYRAAANLALDELRRRQRWEKYLRLLPVRTSSKTPEQLHAADREREQVRRVLSALKTRDAELLVLRSEGLSYEEIAEALEVSATSIGTLLRRAQQAFRKEYVKRYGE
jgi:RNA polymerase sigma-70 factor (ECF subfamily)